MALQCSLGLYASSRPSIDPPFMWNTALFVRRIALCQVPSRAFREKVREGARFPLACTASCMRACCTVNTGDSLSRLQKSPVPLSSITLPSTPRPPSSIPPLPQVELLAAKNLPASGISGNSDPYAIVSCDGQRRFRWVLGELQCAALMAACWWIEFVCFFGV